MPIFEMKWKASFYKVNTLFENSKEWLSFYYIVIFD